MSALHLHTLRILAVLAVLLQVALPIAQAQAAASGTPLASLICNPSGQTISTQAETAMADLLETLGETETPDPMPECNRCVMPGMAVLSLPSANGQMLRFARSMHQHPISARITIHPVRGQPCGTRAPPAFV